MTTVSRTTPILEVLFDQLTEEFGWTSSDVTQAINLINGSQYLVTELLDLQDKNWLIEASSSGVTATEPYGQHGTIFISNTDGGYDYILTGTTTLNFSKAAYFVGAMAYEIGHAEDPQANLIEYNGTDLSMGANVARFLFSEGKSLINDVIAAEDIYETLGATIAIAAPYENVIADIQGSNYTQAIFDGATSTALQDSGTVGVQDLLDYYWTIAVINELSVIQTVPTQIANALEEIDINSASGVTFSNNTDGSDSMTITLQEGSISTYIVNFGNYGTFLPSYTFGGQADPQPTTSAVGTTATYQEFIYKNGSILIDLYSGGQETLISSHVSEILIGHGIFSAMEAGGSLDTLIDMSGSNSLFESAGYSSIIEEAIGGTTGVSNIFSFVSGTNVLFGDLGNNTFVENPTVTSATNIIWGGGGTSTYDLTGIVDIIYTNGTPTPQEIESLTSNELLATLPTLDQTLAESGTVNVNYIIDPTKNDQVEIDDGTGVKLASGLYVPTSPAGYYYPHYFALDGSRNGPVEFGVPYQGQGINIYTSHYNRGLSTGIYLVNFVNGDLGLSFAGNAHYQSHLEYPIAGDLYNYDEKQDIELGSGGNNTVSNGSEYIPSGMTGSGVVVSSGGLVFVTSGGTTSGTSVASGGGETVGSGGNAYGSIIETGGQEVISSAGSATSTTVMSGGSESILSGGSESGAVIQNGGTVFVSSGGIISSATVNAGGQEIVFTGGSDASSHIQSGGIEVIGGSASGAIVSSGGVEDVISGGLAAAVVVQSGALQTVSSGGTSSNTLVQKGGAEVVLNGGVASGTTVNSGGLLVIALGNSASGTNVLSGGLVASSGVVITRSTGIQSYPTAANGVTLVAGACEFIMAGGKSENMVLSGGVQIVFSGGESTSAILDASGIEYVYSGGATSNSIVDASGVEDVLSGGVASNSKIGSGGIVNVLAGGIASNTTIVSGIQFISSGGTAISSTLSSGGQSVISGGYGSATVIANGGSETITAGGLASASMVNSGGSETVASGGSVSASTVNNGGIEFVSSGGMTSNVIVSSGGCEAIYYGGEAASTTVNSGGELIFLGGYGINTTVSGGTVVSSGVVFLTNAGFSVSSSVSSGVAVGNGQIEYILSGTTVAGTIVNSGGEQVVVSGGEADGTTISNGGSQVISQLGTTSATVVKGGGLELVSGGDAYSSASVISSGGELIVSGGISIGARVESGGSEIITSQGFGSGTTISSGGTETVMGSATADLIGGGGVQVVSSGGSANSNTIQSGGVENVVSGGTLSSSVVQSGGSEQIQAGACGYNTSVNSGGIDVIFGRGTASGTNLMNGAFEYDYGLSLAGTVNSGGAELIQSGGLAFGLIVSSGGQDIVSGGGTAVENMIMSHANEYDYGVVVSTTVNSGSGENVLSGGYATGLTIDFGADDYVGLNSTAVATSILNGGNEYDYGTVISAVVSSGGDEDVLSGGSASGVIVEFGALSIVNLGGTAIATSILSGGNEQDYATVISAVVSRGGVENALSGGSASGVVISSGGLLKVLSGGTASGAVISGGGSETVFNGATLGGSIQFFGSSATLSLGEYSLPTNVISGFDSSGTNDEIVLSNFAYSSASDSVTLEAGNTLRLNLGGTVGTLYLDPTQNFTGDTFNLTSNSAGQVVILDPPNGGGMVPKSLDIMAALQANGLGTSAAASRMTFLNGGFSQNGRSMEQSSPVDDFRESDVGSFLGSYSDTTAQLSGTSVRSITVSAHQFGSGFGALTNEPLQSGTQVSTYVHSGFG